MTRSLKQALGATALALFSSAALAQFVPTEMPKFEPATPLTDKPVIPWQTPPMPDLLKNWKPVTADQLKKPSDGEWINFRRTYDGWGYSPLSQINTRNVARLQPVWSLATGVAEGHQAPPQVVNGVMIVATPGAQILALDAATGNVLWRYRRNLPEDIIFPHPTSRGVGILGDRIYFAAPDAFLVAIDIKTGKEVWSTKVADYKAAYYMSLAPLVAGGKVMLGTSGGEYGVRGFVAAFDPDTGKEAWRTFLVPEPGQPGSDTWPKGDHWKTGGASVWVTGTYDSETNLAYWGTGNGGPWMGDQRPGDNLYTSSVVALDVATGAIKGHFQYDPNESWDWDEVSPPMLIDFKSNGQTKKGLVNVARDGYLWWLERTNGKINFVDGKPYVRQNVFKSLDKATGRPVVDEARKPGTNKPVEYCPGVWGGKDWPPAAYNPQTRLVYIPANDNHCSILGGRPNPQYKPGDNYSFSANYGLTIVKDAKYIGEVQAWNVDTGKKEWSAPLPGMTPTWGPLLTTGGGLVFGGGGTERKFRAFDAKSGRMVWETVMPSGVTGTPSSYTVNGKQYVAVQSGWGVDGTRMQNGLQRLYPGKYPEVPQGGSVWVFAVK